jgi:hypothetical protein
MSNGNENTQSYRAGMDERRQPDRGMPGGEGGAPGEDMAEGVTSMASQAREKLMNTAEDQKRAGADYVVGVADAVRRAASEFDEQIPQAGQYIRSAADQMQTMADSVRRRDVGQMLSDVKSFARRQPTAFLGASFLAGFVAIRFLRSSSRNGSGMGSNWQRQEPMDDGRYGSSSAGRMSARADIPPGSGS